MKLINPILFFLLLIFTVVNIIDGLTAFFILSGEANPIYLLFNSIWPILIIKYGLNFWLWFYYKRNIFPSNLVYYMAIIILVLGILLLTLGAITNIIGIKNPELLQEAAQIPTKQKVVQYFTFTGLLGFIPMLFGIVAFILYDKSRDKVVVDKMYFKRKVWWKRW